MKILEQPLYDYVLFDLETTGLDTVNDQIVEISALKVAGGKIVDEYSTLVNPGIHIPYQASCINGITDDMVKDAPTVEEAIRGFKLFAGDEVLIGHNIIRFDMAFITRDVRMYLGKNMDNELVDTVILSRRLLPELDRHSLEALAAHYNVSYEGAHRALADCYINMKVYEHLCEELLHPSEAALSVPVCPKCGNILKKRNGKFGEFWGCRSYPDCRYTRDINSPS